MMGCFMVRLEDMFKIGIGPSSSHTVGPMVASGDFLALLGDRLTQVQKIHVQLYGSLSATGKGHATDTAVLLGLLGHDPKSIDTTQKEVYLAPIFEQKRLTLAGRHAIDFDVQTDIGWDNTCLPYHPNALQFVAHLVGGETLSETYYSVGGGFVLAQGALSEQNASTAVHDDAPYPFDSAEVLLNLCQQHQLGISQLMLANECAYQDEQAVKEYALKVWQVMQSCVHQGCRTDGILSGGLNIKRRAKGLYDALSKEFDQAGKNDGLLAMDWVNVYALAVNEENASGGKVVTAPTNGAAGVIPAVMHYARDFLGDFDEDKVLRFLLTATAIGSLIKQNASISGAEVGCQGEVGSACAMAAAGLAEVMGATPAQVLNAAEIGLEHNLGLTCDPILGLVQVPCIERNAMASVKAINASRLALRGDGQHHVSLDEAILTMKQTGADMMDKYKETAQGGLAIYVSDDKDKISVVNVGGAVNFSQC